jgi:imidazolonepropionase-like amidohydrolase
MIARLAFALVACLTINPATAQTIAITNATVHTIAAPQPIANGTVLIRDGRIAAVGSGIAIPAGATVIDAGGKPVTPGLFNAYTFVGLMDVGAVDPTNDLRAGDAEISAAIDTSYAINAMAAAIPVTRLEGVTRAMVTPQTGKAMFAGYGALVHMGTGRGVAEMDPVFKARAFQYVEMGEAGSDLGGGARSASFVSFVNALVEAKQYEANRLRYIQGGHREALTNRLDTEALIPVANGAVTLLVHVNRASDILAVLALRKSLPSLKLVLVGAAEGWLVADQIAAARVPVIIWALDNLPGRFEQMGATMANAGRMLAKGVTVALGSGPGRDEGFQARLLPQLAGNLVAMGQVPGGAGLSAAEALKAITLTPARVFGVDSQLGTLEPGKLADVVIWDGDPLEVTSAPTAVYINGKAMPMTSRQTELRDRYLDLTRGALPFQYSNR